jgi:hypothetical protein
VATVGRMGRPLRIERAGGWYHVTGRGNERKSIYRDNRDRFHFIGLVAEMVRRFGVHSLNHLLWALRTRYSRSVNPPSSTKTFSRLAICRSSRLHATVMRASTPLAGISA